MNIATEIKIPDFIKVTEYHCNCGEPLLSIRGQIQSQCSNCQIEQEKEQFYRDVENKKRAWVVLHPAPIKIQGGRL